MSYRGVNWKVTGTSHFIIQKYMTRSYTCTALQGWACLDILELNRVSSRREWGVPLYNKSVTGARNVRRGIHPPYLPIYRQMREILYSSSNPEHLLPWPSLPQNGTRGIGQIIVFCSHANHIDRRDIFYHLFFTERVKPRGRGLENTSTCEIQLPTTH